MGSPLGPLLANIFLAFHERSWISDCPARFKPTYYRRYVDDTFLLFRSRGNVSEFLDYLNSKHPNIKFTAELEVDRKLQFLDVCVERVGAAFETSVYRKKTFTGLYTHFSSFTPLTYKLGLMYTLMSRAFRISSSFSTVNVEFERIKAYLVRNGFPATIIDRATRKFLSKFYGPKPVVSTVEKLRLTICLPFTGKHGMDLRKRVTKLIKGAFPQVSLQFVFIPSFRIHNLFVYKDRLPSSIRSKVIYKYTYGGCNSTYIGKTIRQLTVRVNEHIGRSCRTGILLKKPPFSAIREHSQQCNSPVLSENFRIVSTACSDYELCVHESLLIFRDRPVINTMVHSSSSLRLFSS